MSIQWFTVLFVNPERTRTTVQVLPRSLKVFEKQITNTASITRNLGAKFKHWVEEQQANNGCHRIGRRWFVGSVVFNL